MLLIGKHRVRAQALMQRLRGSQVYCDTLGMRESHGMCGMCGMCGLCRLCELCGLCGLCELRAGSLRCELRVPLRMLQSQVYRDTPGVCESCGVCGVCGLGGLCGMCGLCQLCELRGMCELCGLWAGIATITTMDVTAPGVSRYPWNA